MNLINELPPLRSLPTVRSQAIRETLVSELASPSRIRIVQSARRRLVSVASVTAIVSTVAIILVELLSGSTAYATWSAVPDQLDAKTLALAGSSCHRNLTEHFQGRAANLLPVLGEQRGKFTAVILASGPNIGICITGMPHGDLGGILNLSATTTSGLTLDAAPGLLAGAEAARETIGRVVDPNIVRIVVSTTDNRQVTASLAGGFYLAWWPSGADPSTVTGYDSQGNILYVVDAAPTPLSPTKN